MLCLSAIRIVFVRILFAVCVSDGGFMLLKIDYVSVVKFFPVCFVVVSVGLTVLL